MANQNGGANMSDEPKDTGEFNNLRVVNWQGVNYELTRLDQSIRDVREDVRHLDTRIGQVDARIGQVDQKIDMQINALREEVRNVDQKMDTQIHSLREDLRNEIQENTKVLEKRLDKVEALSEKIMGRLNIYGVLVTILLTVIGLIIALRL